MSYLFARPKKRDGWKKSGQYTKNRTVIYGTPKIAAKMRRDGERISDKTVGNYMREMGIATCYRNHRIQTTKDPDFGSKLNNLLDRDFHLRSPNSAWCTNTTYIWTSVGFIYLASTMNLYSRKIISWTLWETLEAKWVLEAVREAKEERYVEHPLVTHSNRGVQ